MSNIAAAAAAGAQSHRIGSCQLDDDDTPYNVTAPPANQDAPAAQSARMSRIHR